MSKQHKPHVTLTQRQREIATEMAMLERAIQELKYPNKPGHTWVKFTKSVGDLTVSDWIEKPVDYRPEPANRPVTEQPKLTRTVIRPGDQTWRDMDRRNWHRTGAPWHTCPNCTTYELVTVQETKRPYHASTGDLIPADELSNYDPTEVEWLTDRKEIRKITYLKMNKQGEEPPKPVTGMNLYRHVDGHEECWDCGWKGEPKQAMTAPAPIRNGSKKTVHPAIDRKALIAQYRKEHPIT